MSAKSESGSESTRPKSAHRARWAAIGAAVAVTVGGGGFGIANAIVTENPKNVYVAIAPCRLADTRPGALNIGPRATPIGAGEVWTVAGTGDVAGPCNLPSGIKALQLNVTAVGATVATYLTLFPAGGAQPLASNLNPAPGQPPTPNSVTVTLAADGNFSIYNLTGTVDVIIDVVGYYDDHRHTSQDITNEAGVSFNYDDSPLTLTGAPQAVTSTAIRVPSDGFVTLEATGVWQPNTAGADQVRCQLTVGSLTFDLTQPNIFLYDGGFNDSGFRDFSMHRTLPVSLANNPLLFISGQAARLLCANSAGTSDIESVQITATFFPTEYEPTILFFPTAEGNVEEGG